MTFLAVCLAGWAIWGVQTQSEETSQLAEENARRITETDRLTKLNRALSELIIREGRERRDQSCAGDERDHLADVRQLRRTYRFLTGPLADQQPVLRDAVIQGLPALEREARRDSAPAFCDEPGIGLPEPDPVLPDRPPGLRP